MNTIIFVSYYFYPYSLIGAKRANFFAKYFFQKGYNIIVLKADNIFYKENVVFDDKEFNKINIVNVNIKVSKNRNLNIIRFYFAFKKKLKEIINNILKDQNNKIKFIFFSGGPFYYFSLGPYFKKRYNVKYILDFRDIWFRHKFYGMHKYNGIEKYSDYYFEKKAIKYADIVIDVTKMISELRKKIYKKIYIQDPDKFITIYNGYSFDYGNYIIDYNNYSNSLNNFYFETKKSDKTNVFNETNKFNNNMINEVSKFDKNNKIDKNKIIKKNNIYKIGIFGKFAYYTFYYNNRLSYSNNINKLKDNHILWLVEIIKIFDKKGINIEVHLIGKKESGIEDIAKKENIEKSIIFKGPMSYEDGIEYLKNMDFFILNNAYKFALGTKIFDYIFLNKPIFAFIYKDSEIAYLLSDFENGYICSSFEEFYEKFKYAIENNVVYLDSDKYKIKKYSRKYQAELLYDKLKKVL